MVDDPKQKEANSGNIIFLMRLPVFNKWPPTLNIVGEILGEVLVSMRACIKCSRLFSYEKPIKLFVLGIDRGNAGPRLRKWVDV